VKPYQIIVAVSVSLQTLREWDPHMPRFPAILDTGNNHNLAISRGHPLRWAGLQSKTLRIIGAIRERQQRIPLHTASVWLHRNRPAQRTLRDHEPHPLKLEEGIAIYPADTGPRLPIFGLRALTRNQLTKRPAQRLGKWRAGSAVARGQALCLAFRWAPRTISYTCRASRQLEARDG
jgi:hypothetical protein